MTTLYYLLDLLPRGPGVVFTLGLVILVLIVLVIAMWMDDAAERYMDVSGDLEE